jgi:3-deoxy-D-manno-octulosonic-acid transferase
VIRFIYNLVWPLGLLLFLPGYLVKMFRRGGYREKFGQRLGIYEADVRVRLAKEASVWLHAVSVGEAAIALKLAAQFRSMEPNLRCALTTTTTTGFAFASKNAPPWIEVMYSPLDFWPVMRRALSVIQPTRIVLIEAEVWPNLVAQAHGLGIPVALVNARLSPRSEKRFRRFRFAVAPTFRLLELVCVSDQEDIERWRALGVEEARIRHTGSIKYDSSDSVGGINGQQMRISQLTGFNGSGLVLFGGSTHPGEERLLAQVFLTLRPSFPSLSLFIAPRHVERVREIRKQLESFSLQVRLTSETPNPSDSKPDCVLLDKTGELPRWYGAATVVFIGKSLTAHGGQNPVEPIAAGVPVIFGPHMENFAALARALVAKNGAVEVSDEKTLEQAVDNLLRDATSRRVLVKNAKQVLTSHRGATARTAALVAALRPRL